MREDKLSLAGLQRWIDYNNFRMFTSCHRWDDISRCRLCDDFIIYYHYKLDWDMLVFNHISRDMLIRFKGIICKYKKWEGLRDVGGFILDSYDILGVGIFDDCFIHMKFSALYLGLRFHYKGYFHEI